MKVLPSLIIILIILMLKMEGNCFYPRKLMNQLVVDDYHTYFT